MRARRLAALLLAAAVLAGCGEKPEPDVTKLAAVSGTVDLARSGPKAPATATTKHSALAFTGRVKPPSSRVTLKPAAGKAVAVEAGADGRFRARARKLRRGENRFVLLATSPGLRPWALNVLITRK